MATVKLLLSGSGILLLMLLIVGSAYAEESSGQPTSSYSTSTTNVENLRILRKSVNFAYKCGNEFLNLMRGSKSPDIVLKEIVTIVKIRDTKLSNIFKAAKPYMGLVVLLLLGLLFVVIVPIVGFCFCLCRCAGKCGGRVKGMDPRHAKCKRYTYAIMLGIISIVMLAGIVLAFINNQLIHDTLTNTSPEINALLQTRDAVALMKRSLRNISQAIDDAEQTSVKTGSADRLIEDANFKRSTIDAFFESLQTDVANELRIKPQLEKISRSLTAVEQILAAGKKDNGKLNAKNNELKKQIENQNMNNLRLPIDELLSVHLGNSYNSLKKVMKEELKSQSSTGETLRRIVKEIRDYQLPNLEKGLKSVDDIVQQDYLDYRMYVCIGVCCFLLLVVLFYFLGLCFGQCGERPFEDARICNRGVGANLMMAGVAFAFLVTPIIMFAEIGLFYQGAALQTEICRYLTNEYPPGPKAIDGFFDSTQVEFIEKRRFESLINNCPTQPMAEAWYIRTNKSRPKIDGKIDEITDIVRMIPSSKKTNIVGKYFQKLEGILLNISGLISTVTPTLDGYDSGSREEMIRRLSTVTNDINMFSLENIKRSMLAYFKKNATRQFELTLRKEVQKVFQEVSSSTYQSVRCQGMANATIAVVNAACVTFLEPFNGFWIGVGICLVFTIPAIIFAVKLAGLYRRTEKYSSDYEEPDYNSYMGFYTNNADNIPMKRPKSGKSNQKGSGKDMKQTNPQYLPVYPYDAYE